MAHELVKYFAGTGRFPSGTAQRDLRESYQTKAGTPTENARFVGDMFFDSANSNWYIGIALTGGASSWKQITNAS